MGACGPLEDVHGCNFFPATKRYNHTAFKELSLAAASTLAMWDEHDAQHAWSVLLVHEARCGSRHKVEPCVRDCVLPVLQRSAPFMSWWDRSALGPEFLRSGFTELD